MSATAAATVTDAPAPAPSLPGGEHGTPAPADDRIYATVSTKYRQVNVCSAEALQTHWYTSRCEKLTLPGCVLYAYQPLGDPARFPSDLPDRLRELERLYLVMDTTPGGWNPKGPLRRAYRDYQQALAMELAGTPLRRSPRLAACKKLTTHGA